LNYGAKGCKNKGFQLFLRYSSYLPLNFNEMKRIVFFTITFLFFSVGLKMYGQSPRINHIALSVLDLKRSSEFYTRIVQLDTIPEPFHDGRHTWLSIGAGADLHLIQNPGPILTPSKNTHLCFSINSVDAIITVLKQNKIPFEDWQGKPNSITLRVDGVKQIYFQDPDGYWIEINDAKE
jgi:lactoylglutathione lyase